MKKFFNRLTVTQFLILWYIPFGVVSSYLNGIPGFIGSVIGWCIGVYLCKNWSAIRAYNYRKFFAKHATPLICLLILIPVEALAYHFGDCKIALGILIGWLIGIITWRRRDA